MARYSGCVAWHGERHCITLTSCGLALERQGVTIHPGVACVCVAVWPDWPVACLAKRNYIAKDRRMAGDRRGLRRRHFRRGVGIPRESLYLGSMPSEGFEFGMASKHC